MGGAHGAGFLYALGKELVISPDITVASSGNAGNSFYFATRQYEFLKQSWTELLSTPKFISFARPWRVMNIDYLIDTVFKRQTPLNIEKLLLSRIRSLVPVTNALSGEVKYFSPHEVDPFELLRATKAIPILFRKKVMLHGKEYLDGEMGPTLEDHIARAHSEGATRILVIDDSSKHGKVGALAMRVFAHLSPQGLREALRRDLSVHSVCVTSPDASILCVKPEHLAVGVATRNRTKLLQGFMQGETEALALEPELRTLFEVRQ